MEKKTKVKNRCVCGRAAENEQAIGLFVCKHCQMAYENGQSRGREKLQCELRALIGAKNEDE